MKQAINYDWENVIYDYYNNLNSELNEWNDDNWNDECARAKEKE